MSNFIAECDCGCNLVMVINADSEAQAQRRAAQAIFSYHYEARRSQIEAQQVRMASFNPAQGIPGSLTGRPVVVTALVDDSETPGSPKRVYDYLRQDDQVSLVNIIRAIQANKSIDGCKRLVNYLDNGHEDQPTFDYRLVR